MEYERWRFLRGHIKHVYFRTRANKQNYRRSYGSNKEVTTSIFLIEGTIHLVLSFFWLISYLSFRVVLQTTYTLLTSFVSVYCFSFSLMVMFNINLLNDIAGSEAMVVLNSTTNGLGHCHGPSPLLSIPRQPSF